MESPLLYNRDETWTPTEKKLARIAFEKAFERQCAAITQEARRMLEERQPHRRYFEFKNISRSREGL